MLQFWRKIDINKDIKVHRYAVRGKRVREKERKREGKREEIRKEKEEEKKRVRRREGEKERGKEKVIGKGYITQYIITQK